MRRLDHLLCLQPIVFVNDGRGERHKQWGIGGRGRGVSVMLWWENRGGQSLFCRYWWLSSNRVCLWVGREICVVARFRCVLLKRDDYCGIPIHFCSCSVFPCFQFKVVTCDDVDGWMQSVLFCVPYTHSLVIVYFLLNYVCVKVRACLLVYLIHSFVKAYFWKKIRGNQGKSHLFF